MELKLTGKYVKFYEKHSDSVLALFCKNMNCNEIADELYKEFGVKIPFQSLVNFYINNKEYIENCKKKKLLAEKEEIKETIAIQYAEKQSKELLFLLSKNMDEDVQKLTPEQRIKLMPTVMNVIAKLGGLEKSEININNALNFEELFDEDIIEDALIDFQEEDERSN